MLRWRNQHQESHQRETIHDEFVIFCEKVNRVSKIRVCIYVSEICAEGIFVFFPWWQKRISSKISFFFSNERHFAIWFSKKKIITFFRRKLSKLFRKDTILHVKITFPLKKKKKRKKKTRTSSGPFEVVSLWFGNYRIMIWFLKSKNESGRFCFQLSTIVFD